MMMVRRLFMYRCEFRCKAGNFLGDDRVTNAKQIFIDRWTDGKADRQTDRQNVSPSVCLSACLLFVHLSIQERICLCGTVACAT
jgi:hypothetical protein